MQDLQTKLDDLGWRLATFGVESVENDVWEIVDFAVREGLAVSAALILGDPSEPAVARERAFARMAAALNGRTSHRHFRYSAA